MKHKLKDFVYDILDFIFNNKLASTLLFIIICTLISIYLLYPINTSLGNGFMGAGVLTTIRQFLKNN